MKNKIRKSFPSGNSYTFVALLTLCGFMLLIVHCDVGVHSPDDKEVDLKKLLEVSRSTEAASSIDVSQYKYLDPKKVPKGFFPLFPIYSFLLGEVYRLRGDNTQAKEAYQGLVEWAAADPYGDGWGVSGLVSVALWRWLQIINTTSNLD